MKTRSLDLGCGPWPKNPFNADYLYGVDSMRRPDVSGQIIEIAAADLAVESIPFSSEMFDYVTAHDFVEHVPRVVYIGNPPVPRYSFVELMSEIHRVLLPGGIFYHRTPAFPYATAFQDPTHVNIITEITFPDYFCVGEEGRPWAGAYGFKGQFQLVSQAWDQVYLECKIQKISNNILG